MTAPLPDVLHVAAHPATAPDAVHDTDSDDLLFWWAGVLGPTGCVIAHRLARYAAAHGPTSWPLDELAVLTGVNRTKLAATFDRLEMYGVVVFLDCTHVLIRLRLPALNDRRLRRLPPHVIADYRDRFGPHAA